MGVHYWGLGAFGMAYEGGWWIRKAYASFLGGDHYETAINAEKWYSDCYSSYSAQWLDRHNWFEGSRMLEGTHFIGQVKPGVPSRIHMAVWSGAII